MNRLATARLYIEELVEDDAGFVVALLNDPDFIANIADREVRNPEDARRFLREGPLASYGENGFGMFAVRSRGTGEPLGICGLVRRPGLDDVDLGYAFLPAARGRGYALEAAQRVMQFATGDLGLQRLVAIVNDSNTPSRRLLEKLGMRFQHMIRLAPEQPELCLYAWQASAGEPAEIFSRTTKGSPLRSCPEPD